MDKWIISDNCKDGWPHHECSSCHHPALFYFLMREDWDEGLDGEYYSLGMVESNLEEFITPFCPYCGKPLDVSEATYSIFGCYKCKHYVRGGPNSGYTTYCEGCGDYPWSNDKLPTKWELKEE